MIGAFMFGAVATTVYNPVAAMLHERSKRLEADMLGENMSALQESTSGFWVRQKSADGAAIINAKTSREQGAQLGGVTIYTFDVDGHFQQRIEAQSADPGAGLLAARGRAHLCQRQGARCRGQLSRRHQSDARAGAGKLCHAGDRAVLGIAHLYRDGGPRRARRRRLSPAISAAAGAAVSARRDGLARGLGEPALLPLRRRAENGA